MSRLMKSNRHGFKLREQKYKAAVGWIDHRMWSAPNMCYSNSTNRSVDYSAIFLLIEICLHIERNKA